MRKRFRIDQLPLPGCSSPDVGRGKYTAWPHKPASYPQVIHRPDTGYPQYPQPYDDDGITNQPNASTPLVPVLPPLDITNESGAWQAAESRAAQEDRWKLPDE